MSKISELREQHPEYTESQLHYALDKSRHKSDYKPRPRKELTVSYMMQLGVKVKQADNEWGWEIYQGKKQRPIFVIKTGKYKTTDYCKYHPYVAFYVNGKTVMKSLASVLMTCVLLKDIPAGYVVDHIDNDSFNNDLSNLQLLSIRENLEKNPSRAVINSKRDREESVESTTEINVE